MKEKICTGNVKHGFVWNMVNFNIYALLCKTTDYIVLRK